MWGRRRKTDGRLWAAAHEELTDATELAGRTYARLDQELARFEGTLEEIRSLLGRGDGVPVHAVQAQLAPAQQVLQPCREARIHYEEARDLWRHPETEDAPALIEAAERFRDLAEAAEELIESLTDTNVLFAEVRDKLVALPAKIAPIRERIHASLAAARAELARPGAAAAGRFTLEARLHAAEDRLRELDAGRVDAEGRAFTDLYRDLEVRIAEVRDALAREGG
ncbi:hypothetical protein [Streptomyces caatingaensis]|uniref:Uncharacterized protein n=1 Tax=Streptomyces caatingaensis TaxID=1678637 RepID=A0A0K9X9M5_9ACTN|nr:hypothetical protein [Streptomyces caatingaensis]KNB50114.1 hypothetical protein AC230_25790 [Streptomyces caatingaensis]